MYAYIKGKLSEINPGFVVIDIHGMGYHVFISLNTYVRIKDLNECKLFIHHVVREDAQLLYGFNGEEERRMFRNLISVSGIGSNTAILILSAMDVGELSQAIASDNVPKLQKIKGIGLKTAQRIIVDLKDKIESGEIGLEKLDQTHNTQREEALSGLLVLGFNKKQAEKALDAAMNDLKTVENAGVEDVIKEALKRL